MSCAGNHQACWSTGGGLDGGPGDGFLSESLQNKAECIEVQALLSSGAIFHLYIGIPLRKY